MQSIIEKLSAERKALRDRIQYLENATSGTQVHTTSFSHLISSGASTERPTYGIRTTKAASKG